MTGVQTCALPIFKVVEEEVEKAEKDFGRENGSVLIMAAIESARGVMRALDICEASERLFGIALSGGDYTKDLQTHITGTGVELMGARQNMVIAARAAGVQCFDTVYTDLDNMEGFRQDVETIHLMGKKFSFSVQIGRASCRERV